MKTLKLSFPRSKYYTWDWQTRITKLIEGLGFEKSEVNVTYCRYALEPDPRYYEPWLEEPDSFETVYADIFIRSDLEGDALKIKIEELLKCIKKEHKDKFKLEVFEDDKEEPVMVF